MQTSQSLPRPVGAMRSTAATLLSATLAFSGAAFAQTIKGGGDLLAALTGGPDVLDPATSSIHTVAQVYEGKRIYPQVRPLFSASARLVFTHYEKLNYLMNKNVTGSTLTPTQILHIENTCFTE